MPARWLSRRRISENLCLIICSDKKKLLLLSERGKNNGSTKTKKEVKREKQKVNKPRNGKRFTGLVSEIFRNETSKKSRLPANGEETKQKTRRNKEQGRR
ncbi:hypothetical protein RUM44_011964 [Polyplax serrata]|uniref:Uncharacterized protein n=1 Tax=Polyplax serrata TaxID=468196 RepID=A0ABR1B9Z1_POLSC